MAGLECTGASAAAPAAAGPTAVAAVAAAAAATSKPGSMRYTVLENPPWWECIGLGFQQYLTMIGSILVPFICIPAMGGSPQDLAYVICTVFFVDGIVTSLQLIAGDRLPLIHSAAFAYVNPTLAVAAHIKATQAFASEHERFLYTMREVQGGVIGSGLIILLVGATGIVRPLLRALGPITVAANIGVLGLALYSSGFSGMMACPQLGLMQMALLILFSQYLKGVAIPLPCKLGRARIFELFPVILSILTSWCIAWIITISGAYDSAGPEVQAACRTDQSHVLAASPWFRFPYPGQWGPISMSWASTLTMLAGALPACVESLGDYFAAAGIVGAPVPPPGLVCRAIALQGASCVLAGLWGTASGTTAINENIAAMAITRVGSRRVMHMAALCALAMGLMAKFGALFASMPNAMVSGLFMVMFGIISAVGLAQMSHTEQHSSRKIFILGFALYSGLSVTYYVSDFTNKHGHGPVSTSSDVFNSIANSVFSSAAAVALLLMLLLDNTIKGSDAERGLTVWHGILREGVQKAATGGRMSSVTR
ncbi:hypothetical protein OEZ86_005555 [Tetradesmus obliquus]|nr:hypothetical protein OEZ86_005555 [Tetradesmus obliquus]